MRPNVRTYTDAAEIFGTDPKTIAGLVKVYEITPKSTGLPGRAKGLDVADMKVIAKALGKKFDPQRTAIPA